MHDALFHAAPEEREHGSSVDARVFIEHAPAYQLGPAAFALSGCRLVQIEIDPARADYLATLLDTVENIGWWLLQRLLRVWAVDENTE
jgi:hypothetical protein